jgi:hypothetical protein
MAIRTKATLTSPWLPVTGILDLLERARKVAEQHSLLLGEQYNKIKAQRGQLEANLSDLTPSERVNVLNRAAGGLRSELKKNTLEARTKLLRELDAARRGIEGARDHYGSPVQMLSRTEFGSERRSRLQEQLAFSGPAEMASLAAFAVSTKDRELGAALVAKVNSMQPDKRPFSPQELADLLTGDEYRSVTAAIMEVGEVMQRAILADRAFETGRGSAEGAVQVALMGRDRRALNSVPLTVEGEADA